MLKTDCAYMKNKVYYGEYSLKHWIELILKGNILLPWYQRSFVWEKEQIKSLIKTLDNNQFIPPIVIGAVKEDDEWKNYILDGQQRLTSILFAKCNKYVDKKEYIYQKPENEIEQIADDATDNEDEIIDNEIKMIKWSFNDIIKDRKFDLIELQSSFYKKLLESSKDEKFFNEHYLGFAFIKPSNDIKEEDQSKFYSDIFRNINTGGTKLTRLETRKALYFLKDDLKDFFSPSFLDKFKVETSSKESGLIDFIKYLSIVSQYRGNNSTLFRYGGRDWEKNENYYQKYIMAVVDNKTNNELHFNISYPTNPYNNKRMEKLKSITMKLNIPSKFNSIIDMDMYFFGLVNEVVFLNKEIDELKKDELKKQLNTEANALRESENHKYNPNALKYLKSRIVASFEIYKQYRR